jgi:hypothetical protein
LTHAIPSLLTSLGKTADDVAAVLVAEGIVAQRRATSFRNPIVRYINRHLDIGGHISIPVGSRVLSVARQGSDQTFRIPDAVGCFLDRFHAGGFPPLEQR